MIESFIKVTVLLLIMVTTEKPKAIMITLRDRKENKSKTLTVYGASIEEVLNKIKKTFR